MRKKLISMLLSLCFVLTLLPVTASAADSTSVKVGGVDLTYTGTPVYATTNTSGAVITEGATADNYNIKFEAGTLTLRNANIQYTSSDPAIRANGDLSVIAVGVNTVAKSVNAGGAIHANNLTLQGTGSLTVISEQYLAVLSNQSLTIGGSITLTAVGGTSDGNEGGCGLYAGQIVIKDNATVTAAGGRSRGGTSPLGSAGIYASDSVTIQGNASVTAVGGDTTESGYSAGIASGLTGSVVQFTGAIAIADNAKVVAVGGKSSSASYGLHADDGPGTGTITYTGGLLVAKGGSATSTKAANKELTNGSGDTVAPLSGAHDSKFAVWGPTGTYTVLSNELSNLSNSASVGTEISDGSSSGFYWDHSNLTLTLKNVIVNAPDGASGISLQSAAASIVLEGVNVVSAGNQTGASNSYGIYGGSDVTVSGETLITLGGSTSTAYSYGMGCSGGISLNAGTTVAVSGSGNSCSGLYSGSATNGITITGGFTVAIGGSGGTSRGMFSNGDINITGGNTVAIGGVGSSTSYGLASSSGKNINITGGSGVAIAGSGTTAKALDKTPQGDATHVPVLTGSAWEGKIAAWKVKTAQTITFANPGAQTFGTTPTLTATASSGLPVTFTSSTPGVATITPGGDLAFESAGTATITAHQAGNDTYAAAEVSQTFTVNAVAPGAPTNVVAIAGDTQAYVSFDPPASTGGSPITGYTVTASPADVIPVIGNSRTIVVNGLTNGVAYTFTVTATNSVGTGPASAASNSITPKATQTITFDNPGAQNFGTTPTLTATSDSGLTVTFTSSTPDVATITSDGVLTFVSAGTATITAHQAGDSSYLAATEVSRSFAVNAVAPGAPTIGTATEGDGQATVTFTAPANTGGVAITGYTVRAYISGIDSGITKTGAGNPITVTGLTNGTAYTFTVTATNSAGTSGASAASNSVTPQTPPPSGGDDYTPPAPAYEFNNGDSISGSNLNQLISGEKNLTVKADKGAQLVFDTDALKGIGGQTTGEIKVEMKDVSPAHQENLPGKLVFSLTVSSGNETISNFGGAVTVSLPYVLKDGESSDKVTVWHLASDGTMTEIPCTYDPNTGLATFTVTHFSLYVVGVDTPWVNPFSDVKETDWFYGAVEFVNRKGLFSGTGANIFSPDSPMTRAMLWTVLGRLDGQSLSGSGVFDAARDWAMGKGITDGSDPDGSITREQMVTILWRYAASPASSKNLGSFSDASNVSDYTKQAMAWAVENGILQGANGALMPQENATRAQVATVLQRFIQAEK